MRVRGNFYVEEKKNDHNCWYNLFLFFLFCAIYPTQKVFQRVDPVLGSSLVHSNPRYILMYTIVTLKRIRTFKNPAWWLKRTPHLTSSVLMLSDTRRNHHRLQDDEARDGVALARTIRQREPGLERRHRQQRQRQSESRAHAATLEGVVVRVPGHHERTPVEPVTGRFGATAGLYR